MTEALMLAALLSMSERAVVRIPEGMAWLWRRRPEDQRIVDDRWLVQARIYELMDKAAEIDTR